MGVDIKKFTAAAVVLVVSYTCKDVYNIVPKALDERKSNGNQENLKLVFKFKTFFIVKLFANNVLT
jgi:hypothetical protein